MNDFDIIVVGAGAAGLMAAGQAALCGAHVLLLDRNTRPGRKLMITGKGRCNVTNACDPDRLMAAMRRNPRFLYSAFSAFSAQDVMRFFEEQGVPLKVERGNRVFPVSDRAVDIVDALQRFVRNAGVTLSQHRVTSLLEQDGAIIGVKTADDKQFLSRSVILATGGLSYPLTGSTGDGYQLAALAGHTLVPTTPSLVALITREPWCSELMGLTLKNVTLSLKHGEKTLFSEIGELLFTHFGVSGPLVLSASSYLEGPPAAHRLLIDLKPGLSHDQLDARLLRDFADAKNRAFKNALDRLLPRRLIPVVVELSGIAPNTQVNAITKQQRTALVKVCKALPISIAALRPIEEAVVTRGGVAVSQVDSKTMRSKCRQGLYFAGELLDLDAVTGGFNLQIAFSTGYLAGIAAARSKGAC
ncbi:MAG: NAD(P)/FAD-dependent oxidoreductase [Oscillospiraceae bacterium]